MFTYVFIHLCYSFGLPYPQNIMIGANIFKCLKMHWKHNLHIAIRTFPPAVKYGSVHISVYILHEWILLVLCLAFPVRGAVWRRVTSIAELALIGRELVAKCQGKIYFPMQSLQVLIFFLWFSG